MQIAAIVGFSIVAVIGVVVAIVSESDDQHRASERYTGGRSACNDFLSAGYDAALGIIIDTELREKLRKVQSKGSTAEPAIRDASFVYSKQSPKATRRVWSRLQRIWAKPATMLVTGTNP